MPSNSTRRDLSADRRRQGSRRKRKSRNPRRLLRREAARQSALKPLRECLDLVKSWDRDPSPPRSEALMQRMAELGLQVIEVRTPKQKRYVNVRVLEMSIGTCALMMRCCDSWVNATQILGLACIRKSDRTKTLRRDIWTGEHQKVQGGNFKYQGTWISYERSIILCRQYGLEYLPALLLHHGFNPRATEAPYENHLAAVNHGLSREIKQEIKEEFKAQIKEEPWDAGGLDFKVTIEPDVLEPAFGRLQSSLTSHSSFRSTEVDVYVFDSLNETKQADFLFDFCADLSYAWTEEAVREGIKEGIRRGVDGESDEGRPRELEKASMDMWIAQKGDSGFRLIKNLKEDWDASTNVLLGSESEMCVVVDLYRHY